VGKVTGCIIGGLVVIAYFMAGGLLSSAWVNLIQLLVMLLGFLVTVPVALHRAGSWHEVTARVAMQLSDSLRTTDYLSLTGAGWSWILGYVILLAPSFIVSPGLLQKIYGAKNERAVRLGVASNALCLLLFAFLPPILGVIAFSQFPALPDREAALPMVMTNMLPPWLGGLALAAVLSAELSTCDAILFMLSTSLSMDLYRTYVNPQANSHALLWVNRITALVAGGLGIVLALMVPSIIAALTIFYGLLVVSLCVPLIGGLYSISVIITLGAHHFTDGRGFGWLPPQALGILISLVIIIIGTKVQRRRVVVAKPE
jgi:SSS family solute:Na+ symporter